MKSFKITCVLILVACLSCIAFAEETKRTAKVISITGSASAKLAGEKDWVPVENEMTFSEGDIIKTKADSWVLLNLNGKGQTATVEIDENSQLLLSELIGDKEKGTQKTLLDLAIGEVLIKAQKLHTEESKFQVKTPTSIVGVRGTKFSVRVETTE